MEEEVYFVNDKGEKISCENISSHIGLANLIFDKDENIKKEFELSGKVSALEFFLEDKGYINVSNMGYYGNVIFDGDIITDEQRKWLLYFHEAGYSFRDLAIEKRELERGEM